MGLEVALLGVVIEDAVVGTLGFAVEAHGLLLAAGGKEEREDCC